MFGFYIVVIAIHGSLYYVYRLCDDGADSVSKNRTEFWKIKCIQPFWAEIIFWETMIIMFLNYLRIIAECRNMWTNGQRRKSVRSCSTFGGASSQLKSCEWGRNCCLMYEICLLFVLSRSLRGNNKNLHEYESVYDSEFTAADDNIMRIPFRWCSKHSVNKNHVVTPDQVHVSTVSLSYVVDTK